MGLGGILQRLKTEGVILVYHDYRSGTLYDWSENNRSCIPNALNFFTSRGINTKSTLTVTNDATLQNATIGTIIVRQTFSATAVTPFLARKNAQFDYSIGLSQYSLTINGVNRTLASVGLAGTHTHAVEFDNAGGIPIGYLNGIVRGNYSGALTSVANAANLTYGYGSSSSEPQLVEYFLWLSRKLTAAEHQELYQQLQALS